jgi:two-component system NtrC family sensor kinase
MFPTLLVLAGETDRWTEPLAGLGRVSVRVTGHEAIQAVRQKSGELVLCEQVAGWRALVRGVEDAGGAVVLLGSTGGDDRFAEHLHATTPAELGPTLALAQARAGAGRAIPSEEEAWIGFAETVAAQPDLGAAAQEICARVRDLCGADLALLFLVNPATGELRPEAPTPGSALKAHWDFARQVAHKAQPIATGTLIGAPVLGGGDVIGVLAASSAGGVFSPRTLSRLTLLARPVASAVLDLTARQALLETEAELRLSHEQLERKVAERTQMISSAKREWEQTFDAIREPIVLLEDHVVRRANLAYASLVGHPVQKVVGQKCHQLLVGRDTPCPGCPLQEGGDGHAELPLKGGTFAVNAFRQSGRQERVVVHYRDHSEERRLQARLRETERLVAVGQLASGAAHEINNPLGFVISNLRLLKSDLEELAPVLRQIGTELPFEPGEVVEVLRESLAGAERVSAIVRGLRELSRQSVETGGAADPSASVTRAVRAELGEEASRVELELSAREKVQVPPLQLDQALQNLLRNAHQATGAGERISVRTRDEADQVVIEISDAGCGIAPEHLPRIFEPFFTTRGIGQGIGLGLTSVYGIVQGNGGSIQVQSQPGQGARFTLRFPRAGYRPIGASASAGVSSRAIAASTAS